MSISAPARAMARAAAEEYRDLRLDVCYCSPLKRARETAEILLKGRDVPIIPDDRLMEMGFGEYEGLADSYKIPDCPINLLFQSPEKYKKSVGGAETIDELFARTGSFLKEVAEPFLEQGKDVLIVGHGAMNSAIISQIKKLPRSEFWSEGIENCVLKKLI